MRGRRRGGISSSNDGEERWESWAVKRKKIYLYIYTSYISCFLSFFLPSSTLSPLSPLRAHSSASIRSSRRASGGASCRSYIDPPIFPTLDWILRERSRSTQRAERPHTHTHTLLLYSIYHLFFLFVSSCFFFPLIFPPPRPSQSATTAVLPINFAIRNTLPHLGPRHSVCTLHHDAHGQQICFSWIAFRYFLSGTNKKRCIMS